MFCSLTETLSEKENDLMPKGVLKASWTVYLKIKVIVSNVPIKHYSDKEKAIYVPHSILIVEREKLKQDAFIHLHDFWYLEKNSPSLEMPKSRNLLTYCQFSDT